MNEYRIVVDAGHGGSDPGAVSGNLKEKDFNLKAANYMYERFKEMGIPVAITRDDDTSLTRAERLRIMTNTFGNDIVIGVECIFTWYWIANFCAERNIEFALGHALYMAAIYKGKTKSDKIDSEKIANMLQGGFFLWLMHIQKKIEQFEIC